VSNKARTWLFSIATGVWALNFVAPLVIRTYEPSTELTVGLGLIIAGLTAGWRRTSQTSQHRNDEGDPDGK
jgi:hypothetical protein